MQLVIKDVSTWYIKIFWKHDNIDDRNLLGDIRVFSCFTYFLLLFIGTIPESTWF